MAPTWYFGPDWDMRPLVCPAPEVDITTETYGGTFQGLSGARSRTYTGARQRFSFVLRFLDPSEFAWLEALNVRAIPGPFRLLSPFKKNLLSANGSLLKQSPGFFAAGQGFSVNGGALQTAQDWPLSAPALGGACAKWIPGGAYGRLDARGLVPVTPGQQVSFSVYAKGDVAGTLQPLMDWFDKTGAPMGRTLGTSQAVSTSWTRLSQVVSIPANVYSARPAVTSPMSSALYLAAAQVENGNQVTTWELGGGAPQVILDSLSDTTSPRYPYVNTTLNLLEA